MWWYQNPPTIIEYSSIHIVDSISVPLDCGLRQWLVSMSSLWAEMIISKTVSFKGIFILALVFRNLTLEERSCQNSWQLDYAFCSMGRWVWTRTEFSRQQSCQWAILELIVIQSKPLAIWCYSWHIDYKFTNGSSPKVQTKLLTNP